MNPIRLQILFLAVLALPSAALADDLCYDAVAIDAADYDWDATSWFGINNSGDMVGNFCAQETTCVYGHWDDVVWGAIYDASDEDIEWFEPPADYNVVQMVGLNERGLVVGTAVAGNGSGGIAGAAAFIYDDGVATVFEDPTGYGYHGATDVNARGTITGYSATAGGGRIGWILYADGAYDEVEVPGAFRTFPFGINNRGDVVGYYLDGTDWFYGAFVLWRDGTLELLTDTGTFFTDFTEVYGYGIDNDGTIVGAFVDWMYEEQGAFVWPAGGEMQRFNVLDYTDTSFHDINEAGSIAGYANSGTDGLLVSPCR